MAHGNPWFVLILIGRHGSAFGIQHSPLESVAMLIKIDADVMVIYEIDDELCQWTIHPVWNDEPKNTNVSNKGQR